MKDLIDKLYKTQNLEKSEWLELLKSHTKEESEYLFSLARKNSQKYFKNKVYVRGLIEFTNYCKNDCRYCGIQRSNQTVDRYRLSMEEMLSCAEQGYKLGFRTFVLQGGEDSYFTDDKIAEIVKSIKENYKDCAVTLSIGEKSYESYQKFWEAGADRYLLRHETANEDHYNKLHPKELSLKNRMECLWNLKKIGYQVGCGFMVGSPFQTMENIVEDLMFIKELSPQMVGIGPFISHKDTCFKDMENGSVELTLYLLGLIRLMIPNVLLPATTALGTLDPRGREKGILAGANVLMPNLSPVKVREKYSLYDNKICPGEEAAECSECLRRRVASVGYEVITDRGDFVPMIE